MVRLKMVRLARQKSGAVFSGLVFVVSLLLLLPLLWYGFGQDQGLYAYEVWLWREFGLLPYANCFDQNFPGIFLIHYFVQLTLGHSVTAFQFFDLVWQLLASLFIFIIVSSVFKNRMAGLIAAFFFCSSYLNLGQWDSGQRDGFLLLLYLAGFWILANKEIQEHFLMSALFAGLLLGFAFLIKPVAALVAVVYLAFILRSR